MNENENAKEAGAKVMNEMVKIETKCGCLILEKVLIQLNALSKFFQTRELALLNAQETIVERFRNIASIIVKREYVMPRSKNKKSPDINAYDINILDTSKYLPMMDCEFGDEIRENLIKSGTKLKGFCKWATDFVFRVLVEMKSRFDDFKNPLYTSVICLRVENATSSSFRKANPNIFIQLLDTCQALIKDPENREKAKRQWEDLPNIMKNDETYSNADKDLKLNILFWNNVLRKHVDYECLAIFALQVLAIPISNAEPERTFSEQNDLKTKKRNRLEVETLSRLILAKQGVKDNMVNNNFNPTDTMIHKFIDKKYYKNVYATDPVV